MTKTLEFLFDFASPNAYLSYVPSRDIAKQAGAQFKITPILLGGLFKLTGNQAPMVAFGDVPNKISYELLEMRRFIEKHGLGNFKMNPFFPVNSLQLMRGLIAAQNAGVGDAYIDVVLKGMWEDEENMADADTAYRVIAAAGIDAEKLASDAASSPVKDQLKSNTTQAAERGAFGVPTFFVGDAMFFGKDRLHQVADALA